MSNGTLTAYIAPTKTGARELLKAMLKALDEDDIEGYWLASDSLSTMHHSMGHRWNEKPAGLG